MKTDNYFEIGTSHDVCQDFALSGKINDKIYYALITDGCTESHRVSGEVDFGARVIAYSARESLKNILGKEDNLKSIQPYLMDFNRNLRNQLLFSTRQVGDCLKLTELFADATLAVVLTDGNIANVFIYGDGGVIVYKRSTDIIYKEVSFLSSAPYYMSYLQSVDRNKAYQIAFGSSPVILTTYEINGINGEVRQANEQIKEINPDLYNKTAFTFDDFLSISVTSDGIKSYDTCGNPIPSSTLAKQFISFKNSNAGFLQRRFNFLKREHKESSTTHYDDVSVATVLL